MAILTMNDKPTFKASINLNKEIKDFEYTEADFDSVSHYGGKLNVVSGDGLISIPLSSVSTVKKIIFIAPQGKKGNVRITRSGSPIDLPFVNYFHYEVDSAEGSNIDSIQFSTSEVVKTDFDVRIIG